MTRPLNLREIDAFRAMMMSGTTTTAAALLNTTQSSVSRLLAQAEHASGLRLFERRKGRLVPTPEAASLFDSVSVHYIGLEQINRSVETIRTSGPGTLRIAATPSLALGIVPDVVRRFRRAFPKVEIGLHTGGSRQIREGLLASRYDVGLTTSEAHFPSGEFEVQVRHNSEALCAVGTKSLLAAPSCIELSDFGSTTLIALERGDDLSDALRQVLSDAEVVPPSIILTSYSAVVCALAAAEIGIGVVSPYIGPTLSANVRLKQLSFSLPVRLLSISSRHTVKSSLSVAFSRALDESVAALQDELGRPDLNDGSERKARTDRH